jgi:hypothetical protein
MEQCVLQNKTLVFESAINKASLQKGMIYSFIEHAVKEGVDCILVKEELTNNEDNYIETIKTFKNNIIQMESTNDNKSKNQVLSK